MSDGKILEMYTAYLAACNNRAWETIAGFLHSSVLVNGIQRTREQYVNDIRKTIAVFPDYAWELRHTVEQAPWLAVHLHDMGTRHHTFLGAPGDQSRSRPTSLPCIGSPTGVLPNCGGRRTTHDCAYEGRCNKAWASGRQQTCGYLPTVRRYFRAVH